MSEVIAPDNTELLTYVLGEIHNKMYVDVVRGLKQKTQEKLEAGELEPADFPVLHHFAPNVYLRQMDAKAGTFCVSKMHRTEHLNILLKGALTIITEDGLQYLKAPQILKSMPGTMRIGYFHEDTSWVTVHPTSQTDLDAIERDVIVPDDEIESFLNSIKYKKYKELA
ncbi:hypothetical protein [Acinetobacter pollinis]|uniref:Cyclic nucleotide-binding domain-containing protein n=1 Tax=Acinetobacter pollinis TaxID=2605270 RepID=A0ABU6DTU1_9GAMM|nr:hypothetical protein [Acinetobacter pollinis]MEB5477271.1 hypothetical protein [Acinetobacter pollinis]